MINEIPGQICSIDNVIPDQLVHVDLPVVSFIQPLDLHVLATYVHGSTTTVDLDLHVPRYMYRYMYSYM